MAATLTTTADQTRATTSKLFPPRRRGSSKLVCFSFAAYAKTLIDHLKSLNVPVLPGLSDSEFTSIESTLGFSFPPDLRSILQEGLPVSPGFPNWRSSSSQQLHIVLNLPSLSLLKEVSRRRFWCRSWGIEPDDPNEALDLAKQLLNSAPVLVPIYRKCYISSAPNSAGNPVFYVHGGDVRILNFDLAGFFQNGEFLHRMTMSDAPAWAATTAREIDFWTEMAESGRRAREWWSGTELKGLGVCLEKVSERLREGGWREEEVWEMMTMDGRDEMVTRQKRGSALWTEKEEERAAWHVRELSLILLRGGWSREDIVYALDLNENFTDGGELENLLNQNCSNVDAT